MPHTLHFPSLPIHATAKESRWGLQYNAILFFIYHENVYKSPLLFMWIGSAQHSQYSNSNLCKLVLIICMYIYMVLTHFWTVHRDIDGTVSCQISTDHTGEERVPLLPLAMFVLDHLRQSEITCRKLTKNREIVA